MWFYLSLLLLAPAGAATTHFAPRTRAATYSLVGVVLVVIIGLRDRVGCDWNTYLLMSLRSRNAALGEALTLSDHGYMFVNWLTAQAGFGIAIVNLACAALFVAGLILFCRQMPRPWLALLIGMPVLVLIAAFSATRQSVAVGLLLLSLSLLIRRQHTIAALLLIGVGATFHSSAIILLPLPLLIRWGLPRYPMRALLLFTAVGFCAAIGLLMIPQISAVASSLPQPGGAWLRALPNLLALMAFPLVWKRAEMTESERAMMFWLGVFAIGCLIVGMASPFLMDRLSFYTVPLQMIVLTRAVDMEPRRLPAIALGAAVASPFALLFAGWLALAPSASCAIPYRSFLSNPGALLIENSGTLFKFNRVTDPWGMLRPYVADAEMKRNSSDADVPEELIQIE